MFLNLSFFLDMVFSLLEEIYEYYNLYSVIFD